MTLPINQIICGDCLEIMKLFPDESIDLIITSPPYNLGNSSGGFFKGTNNFGKWCNAELQNGYKNFCDNIPHEEYVNWQKECLTEMLRLIPDNGAIFYNHKWRVQNGLLQDRYDIVNNFPVRQIIIWKRSGGLNFNDGYFVPTYEVIYVICKQKFKLKPKMNKFGDVWEFTQARNIKHPAPFPIELPDRILQSVNANIVLDPFMGSGTTALAAINNKINYIGIELTPEYCDLSNRRIDQLQQQISLFEQLPINQNNPINYQQDIF